MSVIAPRAAARPTHASRAVLQLSLPFWTKWGQTVVVLGSWDEERKKGQPLACRHTGENELLWETRVAVPLACGHVSYRYAIVNEASEIEVEEGGARIVALPQDLRDTSVIELQDVWQVLNILYMCNGKPIAVLHARACRPSDVLLRPMRYNRTHNRQLRLGSGVQGSLSSHPAQHVVASMYATLTEPSSVHRTPPTPPSCCQGTRSGATSSGTRAPSATATSSGCRAPRARSSCASASGGSMHAVVRGLHHTACPYWGTIP